MNSTAVIQVLTSAAFAGVIVAIVNAIVTRRKLGAEATKIITDAASGVVANIEKDNERLRKAAAAKAKRVDELEARIDDLEDEQREWQLEREEWLRVLEVHAAWDLLAIAKLRATVPPIDLPDPPPLTPPTRPRRRRT